MSIIPNIFEYLIQIEFLIFLFYSNLKTCNIHIHSNSVLEKNYLFKYRTGFCIRSNQKKISISTSIIVLKNIYKLLSLLGLIKV